MKQSTHVQSLFLWCMSAIYFFAFSSLYFQVPGLYGRKGLLPAINELNGKCHNSDQRCSQWAEFGECAKNPRWMKRNCKLSCGVCKKGTELSYADKLESKKTLLWFMPMLGLDTSSGMELLCLFGMILSFGAMCSSKFHNRFTFLSLWISYFSLYQVGQTFLWFQWDILLLETGFVTILLAKTFPSNDIKRTGTSHNFAFWLVKWLLFRLMFQSGVVKLQSDCPTWWGLTALNWHYESQCLPTPLAWYAHQFPEWFQKLSVVATFVIEIAMPFSFFVPIRSIRIWGFFSQMLLQILIILTGNYNFFNLMTMALCLSLIDDEFIIDYIPSFILRYFCDLTVAVSTKRGILKRIILFVIKAFIYTCFMSWMVRLFNVRISESGELLSDIMFTKDQFNNAVTLMTQFSIYMGVLSLLVNFFQCMETKTFFSALKQAIVIGTVVWVFALSMVPFTRVDSKTHEGIWPIVKETYGTIADYHIVNSYGLFRSMTGVGGRPEVIIEGTNDLQNGPWKEYDFKYKPGNLNAALPIVAPHQPRLDWQMWFAALGSYQHNPWFIHLIYKLLKGEKDVLDLMDANPFPEKPPTFIRSRLFNYHYTQLSKKTSGIIDGIVRSRRIDSWWRRDSPKEYIPSLSLSDQSLINFVQKQGWTEQTMESEPTYGSLIIFLKGLGKLLRNHNPTIFMLLSVLLSIVIHIH